jgi:hypothetical protein
MTKESTWLQEQGIKFNNRLQKAIEEEFSRTHDIIMKDYIPKETAKDKGTMRNINNYRMKLWSEVLIEVIKNHQTMPTPSEVADKALEEFDKRFN